MIIIFNQKILNFQYSVSRTLDGMLQYFICFYISLYLVILTYVMFCSEEDDKDTQKISLLLRWQWRLHT